MEKLTMEKLTNYCKQYGFIFQGSEIYGGLANTWDYGPLGVELKENMRRAWWQKFIQESPYNYGIQSAILMNPKTWEVSGHLTMATDPLMDCRECKERFRADKIVNSHLQKEGSSEHADGWSHEELENYIKEHHIKCPNCGGENFTEIRDFNIMFKTFQGVTEDKKSTIYLRPETAQGMFVNFLNVQRSMRAKFPFGIGQTGKSFRNEITPGNFTFRTREFEQMELEFFCKPGEDEEWFNYWKKYCMDFLLSLGMNKDNLHYYDQSKEELAHYSKATTDIEYNYPFGFDELWGVANRTDHDLKNHMKSSGEDFMCVDPETNEKFIPYCIEPALGLDRVVLAFLCDSYKVEELDNGDTREVLKIHPFLAPYKVAVLPLNKKYHGEKAREVYGMLAKYFSTSYDETASIGKRYRRQDAVGTPFVVTVDDDTMNNGTVTLRNRDTMEQIVLPLEEVVSYVKEKVKF